MHQLQGLRPLTQQLLLQLLGLVQLLGLLLWLLWLLELGSRHHP